MLPWVLLGELGFDCHAVYRHEKTLLGLTWFDRLTDILELLFLHACMHLWKGSRAQVILPFRRVALAEQLLAQVAFISLVINCVLPMRCFDHPGSGLWAPNYKERRSNGSVEKRICKLGGP